MNSVERSYKSKLNNAQGHFFEQAVLLGCEYYRENNIANIHKTAEPFRVLKKLPAGKFTGQFIKKAEPDFKGTLKNGRSIVFECKYTTKDRISKSVLSENQNRELLKNWQLGADVGVCICFSQNLINKYFFVPYFTWNNMESYFKKKSVTVEDLKAYEIQYEYSKGLLFLKNIIKECRNEK